MNKSSRFLELLNGFVTNYMPCSIGASPNTVTSYKYAFRLLLEFMYSKKEIPADEVSFEQLDFGMLTEFFDWIENERGCSASTKNQRLSALLSFSEYAQNRDVDAASIFRSNIIRIPMKKLKRSNGRCSPCRKSRYSSVYLTKAKGPVLGTKCYLA